MESGRLGRSALNEPRTRGALAEIGFRLGLEPVWPSRIAHDLHRIGAQTERTLRFASIEALRAYGIDPTQYAGFDYEGCSALAAAVPSARYRCQNLVIFMDRGAASSLDVRSTEPVDWAAWRAARRR